MQGCGVSLGWGCDPQGGVATALHPAAPREGMLRLGLKQRGAQYAPPRGSDSLTASLVSHLRATLSPPANLYPAGTSSQAGSQHSAAWEGADELEAPLGRGPCPGHGEAGGLPGLE